MLRGLLRGLRGMRGLRGLLRGLRGMLRGMRGLRGMLRGMRGLLRGMRGLRGLLNSISKPQSFAGGCDNDSPLDHFNHRRMGDRRLSCVAPSRRYNSLGARMRSPTPGEADSMRKEVVGNATLYLNRRTQ